jgi:type II secretory pathway pseudopilin PulG
MLKGKTGFTLIETFVVFIVLAVVVSIAIPRAVKVSPAQQVDRAARSLMRDLEQTRMRAIAAKRSLRVRFYESDDFYTAFLDLSPDRSAVFNEEGSEVRASGLLTRDARGAIPGVKLSGGVRFGIGSASSGPLGESVSGAIGLQDDYVEFNARGLVVPEGAGGVIYLVHEDDADAVAAVTISGASAFRTWRLIAGTWVK